MPAALAAEWEALADRCAGVPFVRPGWIDAWWGAFGTGSLEIETVRRDGRVVALVPLARGRATLRSPTNFHTPLFGFLAEDANAAEALAAKLLGSSVRRLAVAYVDAAGPELAKLSAAAQRARRRTVVRMIARSPYLEIDTAWDEYERSLSRNLRGDVHRCRRRLEEAGEVSFGIEEGSERLDELLDEGFRLEAADWKTAQRTAIVSRSETERFYRDVARWSAERGWLRLAFLHLDGSPVAFQYALEAGGVYYPLKAGYDSRFREFSPGKLIIHETLSRAFAVGLRRYEFLGDEAPYKLAWSSASRELVAFQVFARSAAGLADESLQAYGRPVAKSAVVALRRIRRKQLRASAG